MVDKFFTPKEANQILPGVKNLVEEILTKANEMRFIISKPDPSQEFNTRLDDLDQQMKNLMGKLEDMGCYYKDWNFEIVLVDFPAIIHGQEALLCWRSDEPQVAWFHGLEDGYAGRRPISNGLIFS